MELVAQVVVAVLFYEVCYIVGYRLGEWLDDLSWRQAGFKWIR